MRPVEHEASHSSGCSLQLPSSFARKEGTFVFTSDREGNGFLNLDGNDLRLDLVKAGGAPSALELPPDGSSYLYEGGGVSVRVDYMVTGDCPAHSDCKLIYYDARLSVKRGKDSKTVAAKAVCARE